MAESGGYDDVIFLVPPSKDFQCIICLLTVREPHLITCCGAIICKYCMLRANVNEVCPQCRDTNPTVVPDKRTKGHTMSLKVKCSNEDCKWTGELIDYQQHIEQKCSSRTIKCKYGCGQYFLASAIETHEVAFCTKRPSDVIISYQQRLIQAMEKEKNAQLQLQQKSAEEVQKLKTENQSYKNRLSNLESKLAKMSATHADSISKIQSLEKERTTLQLQLKRVESAKFHADILVEDDSRRIQCPTCTYIFCKNCKNQYHDGGCAQAQPERQTAGGVQAAQFNRLQQACWKEDSEQFICENQDVKRCPRCQIPIKRYDGCNRVTCTRCHFEFCWLCQIQWETRCQHLHWFGGRN